MVGRPVGVVTVEVVVLVPAPALRRLVEGREGAVVVVAVVAGRVRVEVTGRGRLDMLEFQNSLLFYANRLSFVPVNLHRCWSTA